MSPAVTTGVFTVAGAIVVGILSLIGIFITQRAQADRERERDRLSDARALRDAKLARLRSDYKDLLAFVWTLHDLMGQEQERRVLSSERQQEWIKAMAAVYEEAMRPGNRSVVGLAMETEAQGLIERYEAAMAIFRSYFTVFTESSPKSDDELEADRLRIFELGREMDELARREIARLDQAL